LTKLNNCCKSRSIVAFLCLNKNTVVINHS